MLNNIFKNIEKLSFFRMSDILNKINHELDDDIVTVFKNSDNFNYKENPINNILINEFSYYKTLEVEVNFFGLMSINSVLLNLYHEFDNDPDFYNEKSRLLELDKKEIFALINVINNYIFHNLLSVYKNNNINFIVNYLFEINLPIKFKDKDNILNVIHNNNREYIKEIFFVGFLNNSKNFYSLVKMIEDIFKVKCNLSRNEVILFWFEDDEKIKLGDFYNNKKEYKHSYNKLGENSILGHYIYQSGNCIKVTLLHLDANKFLSFLPNQKNKSLLLNLVRRYLGKKYNLMLELTINILEITPFYLKSKVKKNFLGWNTWLNSFSQNYQNTILFIYS